MNGNGVGNGIWKWAAGILAGMVSTMMFIGIGYVMAEVNGHDERIDTLEKTVIELRSDTAHIRETVDDIKKVVNGD